MEGDNARHQRRRSDFEAGPVSRAEIREIFRDEGKQLIANTFAYFGVDIEKQDERNRLRDNLVWADTARRAQIDRAKTFRRGLITSGVGAALSLLAWLFKIRSEGG